MEKIVQQKAEIGEETKKIKKVQKKRREFAKISSRFQVSIIQEVFRKTGSIPKI